MVVGKTNKNFLPPQQMGKQGVQERPRTVRLRCSTQISCAMHLFNHAFVLFFQQGMKDVFFVQISNRPDLML